MSSIALQTVKTAHPMEVILDDVGFEWRGDAKLYETLLHLWKITAYSEGQIRVLLNAPTGCGKELLALATHRFANNEEGQFAPLNCSLLDPGMAAGELFGVKKGTYTGQTGERQGIFEIASSPKDTIFLDEVHQLAPVVRAQLLRVLSEGTFLPVGDPNTVYEFHGNVVSAASGNIDVMRQDGVFPEDLWARLSATDEIRIPAFDLRDDNHRRQVIEFGFHHWLTSKNIEWDPKVVDALMRIPFPHNIRDLQSFIRQLASYARADNSAEQNRLMVTIDHFNDVNRQPRWHMRRGQPHQSTHFSKDTNLHEEELRLFARYLEYAARHCGGNQTKISDEMGINRNTLPKKIVEWALSEEMPLPEEERVICSFLQRLATSPPTQSARDVLEEFIHLSANP